MMDLIEAPKVRTPSDINKPIMLRGECECAPSLENSELPWQAVIFENSECACDCACS